MSDNHEMTEADVASSKGQPDAESHNDSEATNDTEERYSEDESPRKGVAWTLCTGISPVV